MAIKFPGNFGNAAKDGLKGTTRWAVYYFTNPNSQYPVLERAMILSATKAIQPLPPLQVTVQSIQKMRDWAKTFVAAVRQRSVTQETTMALAGTLYLYQKEIQPGEPVSLERSDFEEQQENSRKQDEKEDGILKQIPRVMMMTFHLWMERLILPEKMKISFVRSIRFNSSVTAATPLPPDIDSL